MSTQTIATVSALRTGKASKANDATTNVTTNVTTASASCAYAAQLPHATTSLCPECLRRLPAIVYEKGGKVLITRTCPQHGEIEEVYQEDTAYYEKVRGHAVNGVTIEPTVKDSGASCPFECGLCARHKSNTCIANLVVTNRCNLRCWYCFFYAKEGQSIYEPTMPQIEEMLHTLRNEKPIPCSVIQFTGGEPLLRNDIVEIVALAKSLGFTHIQLNTTGIKLAFDAALTRRLRAAGVNTLYLSFDGVTPKTNPKNHWEIPRIIENCRSCGLGITLVPTVIKSINDHELGAILNFALNHIDIVRCVNFQPVSLVGRMPTRERKRYRITIPEVLKRIERQTNGAIAKSDFYSCPFVYPITDFVAAWRGSTQYGFTTHFACGAATYIFLDGNKVIPVTRFVDVEGLFAFLNEKAAEIKAGANKYFVLLKLLLSMRRFIDAQKQPRGLNVARILFEILVRQNYSALAKFHVKALMIGLMHFMDLYNYDIERVERCVVHYVLPDQRIIPFCAFNVLPDFYRDKVQAKYSIPWRVWRARHGGLEKDIYLRDKKALESDAAYARIYNSLRNYFA